jgi:hypothetical protein
MSTPKKGSKPIKITLTENQISDIITQTARTRKGLKAESLEDRIAPSMIGAPLDPSMVPLPDGSDPINPEDPTTGLPGETVGDAGTPYNPFLPPPDPSNPPLPGQPLPAGYDPTVAPTFVGGMTPQFPGGFGAQYGPTAPPPAPFAAPTPGAPPSPFVGSGAPGNNLPGGFGGGTGGFTEQFGHPPELPLENPSPDGGFVPPPAPIGPVDAPLGEVPVGGEPLPEGGELPPGAPIIDPVDTPPSEGPSAEELQSHRQNILRQLRGQ